MGSQEEYDGPATCEPDYADLRQVAVRYIGPTHGDEPEAIVKLAAVGITNGAWRNTHLETLHAGNHPSGGFPDTEMMQFNIATTRVVSDFVTVDGVDWEALREALSDPERLLRGGMTVVGLAGEEFGALADDMD